MGGDYRDGSGGGGEAVMQFGYVASLTLVVHYVAPLTLRSGHAAAWYRVCSLAYPAFIPRSAFAELGNTLG